MSLLQPRDLQFIDAVEGLYVSLLGLRDSSGILQLDLKNTSFVKPRGILGLVTVARLWKDWTGHPVVLSNIQHRVHAYLERMDLFTECSEFLIAANQLDETDRLDRSSNSYKLLEILPIPSDEAANARSVPDALRRAKHILGTWLDDDDLIGSVLTLLSEIGQNVIHSEDQGFAIIQRYKKPYSLNIELASEIRIGIADLGIGIEESLCRRTPSLLDRFNEGSDFILHALEQGTSGHPSVRGLGLYRVRSLVKRWQGSLTIRSFSSSIHIENDRIEVDDTLPQIPGVQVFITVRGSTDF